MDQKHYQKILEPQQVEYRREILKALQESEGFQFLLHHKDRLFKPNTDLTGDALRVEMERVGFMRMGFEELVRYVNEAARHRRPMDSE